MLRNNSPAEPTRSAGVLSVDIHDFCNPVSVKPIDKDAQSFSQCTVHFFAVKRQYGVEVDDLFVIDRQRTKWVGACQGWNND